MKMLISLGLCLLALTAGGCHKKPTQPPTTLEPIYPPFEVTDETIIFVSAIDGYQWNLQPGWNLFLMNSEGSNITPRTSEMLDSDPAWSFDRKYIVFNKGMGQDTNMYHIYIMKNDGSELKRLTRELLYWEQSSCFSPDGMQICFGRAKMTPTMKCTFNLWLMDTNGANQRQVTFLEYGAGNPDWSPDGSRIVFESGFLAANGYVFGVICIMNSDGSNIQMMTPHQITDTAVSCKYPAWSPDGSKIAYSAWINDTMAIWTMNADGSNKTKISQRIGDTKDYHPSWSLDGTRIAFHRLERLNGQIYSDIWIVNSDGSNQHRITYNGKSYQPTWR